VAAVIIEPVLGEGGFVVPPPGYFQRLRSLCDDRGILLIADEIQTGIGRTGKMFACETLNFVPDILITAKSLAAGLPLASVTGRAEVMESPVVGGLGGTYGGNPLACAVAQVVLDKMQQLCDSGRIEALGARLRERLEQLATRYPIVGEVRGLGAMLALELMWDHGRPAKDATNAIQKYCYEHGVILITAGTDGNILRLLMPLIIGDEQLDEGLEVVEAAFEKVAKRLVGST
jgi:4-aminobutyrate aminotransferase/(S)-3-amino-2-methylpropionate transaminase